ncbi:tetratricopeptide repeat protein [Denitromonas iodatirespirans]|uniref:Tetratricopeptide repeat protein n=1 Tax=Denitromonas iodatirespirans TaxID=2795389 RepID=A0A944HAH1_DENI1|nr:tetratricopeptide repeat protein [Denitromonas iodatirespirans]MBT0960577.1 tetratricopeptide repeat protein [Denitromonas iodatirespirans]
MTMRMIGAWPRMKMAAAIWALASAVPAMALSPSALGDAGCGSLDNHFGPFDYRVDKRQAAAVESAHFTPEIESLLHGKSGSLGGELDYTLRALPNHHRALMSMVRLGFRDKTERPHGARYKVECWLIRGEVFRDDDPMVKMIYGVYLLRKGRTQDAVEKLEAADKLGEDNANLHYNLGLAYVKIGRYDDALRHAHKAYAQGFPLPGLREQLQRAGKWRAPTADEQHVDADRSPPPDEESRQAPIVAD